MQKQEVWKDVKNFEGIYQVSNKGRVKSLKRKVKCRANKERVVKESILKNSLNNRGYYRVNLMTKGLKKYLLVHRLVGIAFIKNPENKRTINHIDGNKLNNNDENLEWATDLENINHSKNVLGNSHGMRRLMNVETKQIYRTLQDVLDYTTFSKSHLSAMLNGHYKNKSKYIYIE